MTVCNLVKLGDLKDALQSFEKALDLAKILEDDAAENAISKAINDVNDRITQGEWVVMVFTPFLSSYAQRS